MPLRLAGKAVLSINDHPDIKWLFKGFKVSRLKHTHASGGSNKPKSVGELVYCNW